MSHRYISKDYIIMLERKNWAYQLAEKDQDFRDYVGAPTDIIEEIVLINVAKKKLLPILEAKMNPFQYALFDFFMDLRKEYLIQLNKAFFASTCGEMSKLGMFLASTRPERGVPNQKRDIYVSAKTNIK